MDDVLADFTGHFNATIEHDGLKRNKFNSYEKKILGIKDWWLKMPPKPGYRDLLNYTKDFDLHILSAAPSWDPGSKNEKIAWVQKYTSIPLKNINIVTRADKVKFANPTSVLVDDYIKNINEWEGAGGIGILYTTAPKAIAEMKKKLNT